MLLVPEILRNAYKGEQITDTILAYTQSSALLTAENVSAVKGHFRNLDLIPQSCHFILGKYMNQSYRKHALIHFSGCFTLRGRDLVELTIHSYTGRQGG